MRAADAASGLVEGLRSEDLGRSGVSGVEPCGHDGSGSVAHALLSQAVLGQLEDLLTLAEDWDSYGGFPPTRKSVSTAQSLTIFP